jgi:hypothetical protein
MIRSLLIAASLVGLIAAAPAASEPAKWQTVKDAYKITRVEKPALFPFPFSLRGQQTPAVVTHLGNAEDTSNASTYTFTSFNLGAAVSTRRIYVCVRVRGTSVLESGVTIGGTACEAVRNTLTANTINSSIWFLDYPSGTSASIVVSVAGTPTACSISVFSTTSEFMLCDCGQTTGLTTASTVADIKVVAGGFVLLNVCQNTNAVGAFSWEGTEPVVEDYDATLDATFQSAAGHIIVTTSGLLSDATWTGTNSSRIFTVASFEPVRTRTGADFVDSRSSTANASSYTFSPFAIGKPAANRLVAITISWIGTATITGVTINGAAMSSGIAQTGALASVAIYYATVTTLETCTITVTTSVGVTNCAVAMYVGQPSSATPLDTVANFTGAALTLNGDDLQVAVGGFAIFGATVTGTATLAWSGIDTEVTDYVATVESDGRIAGHVDTTENSLTGDLTITNSENNDIALVAVSWS